LPCNIDIALIGNDTNPVKSSPNFKWNNLLNYLYVNGDIYANNIIADNISRLVASNIVGNIGVINGGTGCNVLPYGSVLIGNNKDSLITSPNLIWSNITDELIINGNIISTNIQGSFIGDGNNLSNFNINNILGVINLSNGVTGCNNIPYGELLIGNNNDSIITTKNLIWSNVDKKLLVNGNKDNFTKYPIGEIIIELNDKKFNNYDEFINICKEKIVKIKTSDNEIYLI
jgi:hypothetical protein